MVCNCKEIGEVFLVFVVGVDVDCDDNIGFYCMCDFNGYVIGDIIIY